LPASVNNAAARSFESLIDEKDDAGRNAAAPLGAVCAVASELTADTAMNASADRVFMPSSRPAHD
jgi:hypothetical protein